MYAVDLRTQAIERSNTPIMITRLCNIIFHGCKNDYFQMKNCDFFLIFAQIIDRAYTLEPPQ